MANLALTAKSARFDRFAFASDFSDTVMHLVKFWCKREEHTHDIQCMNLRHGWVQEKQAMIRYGRATDLLVLTGSYLAALCYQNNLSLHTRTEPLLNP